MQYVGRAIGSVSKTWNSINPATLSGAIDVIVVEQENGDLACSPFHVRFGKFSLLRPSQKKVEFSVNDHKTDFAMKLGEGGEAFFVFETEGSVPKASITSPIISASSSPSSSPGTPQSLPSGLQEPEFLDLSRPRSVDSEDTTAFSSNTRSTEFDQDHQPFPVERKINKHKSWDISSNKDALEKVKKLTKKLTDVNIPSKITDNGDIILDVNGYKSQDNKDLMEAENIIRDILSKELGVDFDLETGAETNGHVRIFSKEQNRYLFDDYSSDDNVIMSGKPYSRLAFESDTALVGGDGSGSPNLTGSPSEDEAEEGCYYVKTLRLTSDQLKSLNLHPGKNDVTFSVNQGKAVCSARMFYWTYREPIVISDIDGTITKSDALGHVLTMLGRDWTHSGVAKLFTDIRNNGYNIMYLTARSVGQADSTRYYLQNIDQNGVKLPDGPVILSPDRTIAALRREVIMKKPEIFKMSCLKDIQSLYGCEEGTQFFAGFGNRFTDALSYRYVGVPSSRIFTINSNSEVHMELLEFAGYKSSYVYIADLVDHFFPPFQQGLPASQDNFTDVNYWRQPLMDLSELSEEEEEESALKNDNESTKLSDGTSISSAINGGRSTTEEAKTADTDGFIHENPGDSFHDEYIDETDETDEEDGYDEEDLDEEEDLDGDLLEEEQEHEEEEFDHSYHENSLSNIRIQTASELLKDLDIRGRGRGRGSR